MDEARNDRQDFPGEDIATRAMRFDCTHLAVKPVRDCQFLATSGGHAFRLSVDAVIIRRVALARRRMSRPHDVRILPWRHTNTPSNHERQLMRVQRQNYVSERGRFDDTRTTERAPWEDAAT